MKSICYIREIYLFNKIHFIDHTTAQKTPSLPATSSPVSTIPWIIKLAQQKIIKFVDYSLYMPVIPILVLSYLFSHTPHNTVLSSPTLIQSAIYKKSHHTTAITKQHPQNNCATKPINQTDKQQLNSCFSFFVFRSCSSIKKLFFFFKSRVQIPLTRS